MVDIHCHILPGLDDGPATMDEAVELGRAAEAAGVRTMAATPHIREDHPFPLELMAERRKELEGALKEAGVELEIVSGGEVAVSMVGQLDDQALAGLCLGAGPYLLVESPYTQATSLLETVLFGLQVRGFRPILAHPERSPSFLRDRQRLETLVERGIFCSVTAMSITGAFGNTVRTYAMQMFATGLVHNVASDAHGAKGRAPGFDRAFDRLGTELEGAEEAQEWLTTGAGTAIIEGRGLPVGALTLRSRPSGWRRLKGRAGFA